MNSHKLSDYNSNDHQTPYETMIGFPVLVATSQPEFRMTEWQNVTTDHGYGTLSSLQGIDYYFSTRTQTLHQNTFGNSCVTDL